MYDVKKILKKYNDDKTQLWFSIKSNDTKMITYYRGRLISDLNKLLSKNYIAQLNPSQIPLFQSELKTEMSNHKNQLNSRIKQGKTDSEKYSISNEVVLKLRKTSTSIKQIKTATTKSEKAQAILNTTGNSLSTLFSVSKFAIRPATTVIKYAGGAAGYVVGYAVGLPINYFGNLFGTIINPDRKWNWEFSKNVGGTFKGFLENTIGTLGDTVIRM